MVFAINVATRGDLDTTTQVFSFILADYNYAGIYTKFSKLQ